jgi:hypothetical protein
VCTESLGSVQYWADLYSLSNFWFPKEDCSMELRGQYFRVSSYHVLTRVVAPHLGFS